jgi:PTS system nitrogen regulatory IIA component
MSRVQVPSAALYKRSKGPSSYYDNKKGEMIMTIMDFLSKKAILADLKSSKKEDVLNELVDLLINAEEIKKSDRNKVIDALMERESLGSTAIGQGIAIPHAKSDCVDKLVGAFALSRGGIDFDSLDGEPVYIFFLLLAAQDSAGPHLKALARISRLFKDKYFRDNLRSCADDKAIIKVISQEDEKV